MRITILESAVQDLLQGQRFYEQQEPGLGSYFIDSLFRYRFTSDFCRGTQYPF